MGIKFKRGLRITIRPEWRDKGDENIEFRCVEDEEGGRVQIVALLGMVFEPAQIVHTDMIELYDREGR